MNADVRELAAEAERAVRAADWSAALRGFAAAGTCATGYGLSRAALRLFKRALEIDLLDGEALRGIARLAAKLGVEEWSHYQRVAEAAPAWPHFGCRTAQVVIGDRGATIECPPVGAVLDLMMTEADLIELSPEPRFRGMPLGMALIIVRRAMWPAARDQANQPASLRVRFDGSAIVRLDELGDWEAIDERSRTEP